MSANRVFPKGIAGTLIADGVVNGFISGRVAVAIAPTSMAYPYIVIALSSGVSPNTEPGNARDHTYIVRCVSPSQAVAAQVASAVYNALHHADIDLDSPWKLLQIQHMQDFEFVEDAENSKLFHSGGLYRIRANQ